MVVAEARTRQVRKPSRPAPPARVSRAPVPWAVTGALVVLGLGFGAVMATAVTTETLSELRANGGVAMFLGGVAGLAGTYLALIMVLLVSRVPIVETVLGFDGLLRWHRRLAPWPISLIAAHVVLLVIAYAQAAKAGVWHEVGVLVSTFPYMISATIGFIGMMVVAALSARVIRSRIRRERWWAFHLFMYLALALSFAHIIVLGPSFVRHPLTRLFWVLFWVATAGLVIAYRFGLPIVRSLRHGLRVSAVKPEGPGVVSIILRGKHLDRLGITGGQFFEWRFLARGMWWQAHPFTLSGRPSASQLRLTVKALGDYSSAIAQLKPGTPVLIEGPYGVFTVHRRRRRKAVLISGGIGVTAIRSLLEDMPQNAEPVVIMRASTREDLVLADEVVELTANRKGRVYEWVGPRSAIKLERIAEVVPDLKKRDIYVAGPKEFVNAVANVVSSLGVPAEAVHFEAYELT